MKDQKALPEPTNAQMHQSIDMIPDHFWNVKGWTCGNDVCSTLPCPYLSVAQCLYFEYIFLLFQVTDNPQMEMYSEEKLQWRIASDKEKSAVAKECITEISRVNENPRDGNGREKYWRRPNHQTKWAPWGRRRTPYPQRERPMDRRGVFALDEEGSPMVHDERENEDEDSGAHQRNDGDYPGKFEADQGARLVHGCS